MALSAIPKTRLIIIGAVALIIVVAVSLALFGKRPPQQQIIPLTMWGVFDEPRIINDTIAALGDVYSINYRKFDIQTYETELINALAAGRGPDIFMIQNTWLPKHFDKLRPVSSAQLSLSAFQSLYPTVVNQDFAPDGPIFALPLYIDTLSLLYNKDMFDSAGIALPPTTWDEFQSLIPQLIKLDETGRITRAAAAMGGSQKNINRATDLLNVLMLQSGSSMVDPGFTRALFSSTGQLPLTFYTNFSNPNHPSYTWSDSFRNSLDGFAEESIAMIFNYGYQLPNILNKNPFLPVGVAPLPQPSGAANQINYANYWGLGVSNTYQNPNAAWGFIISFLTDPAIAESYAQNTNRLPALRTLLAQRVDDEKWGTFAKQALSARSWPQIDSTAIEGIFSQMIDDVISGRQTVSKALQEAEDAITTLMVRKRSQF